MANTNYSATVVVYYKETEEISALRPYLSYSIEFATAADLLCEFHLNINYFYFIILYIYSTP